MAIEHPRLKLGKRASFVKTHLKQLPQAMETWEADFRALPRPAGQTETPHLGVVVALPHGDPLHYLPVDYTPSVNDLADLLAEAMRRPLSGPARRPDRISFRPNPLWKELFPHLGELGIEVTLENELPRVQDAFEDFLREVRKASPRPIIMVSPGRRRLAEEFPAVARWVQGQGRIEIGQQEGVGLVVWALDHGGTVFENNRVGTLDEVLAALETGLAGWFKGEGTKVRPASRRRG